jgi:hypothetical protein
MTETEASRSDQRLQARREEAIAFFHVNQTGRTAVERVVALFFSVAAIAGSVGVAAGTPDVLLPLPALLFLLLSYMFQQYSDLTVLGSARHRLEDLINAEIEAKSLIYETAVAQIRQVPPLASSVRFLQTLLGLVVLGATVVATIVAFQDHSALIRVGYVAGTLLAMLSALYSYVHMLRTPRIAAEKLAEQGLDDRRLVWISSALYEEATAASLHGELDRQTFERLLRAGVANNR